MKKKVLGIVIIASLTVMGSNIIAKSSKSCGLLLTNVEALAQKEATAIEIDCYSIFEGSGSSISCATCQSTTGTPPWYHFGSKCTR